MAGTSPWGFEIRQCLYMALGVLAAVVVGRTPLSFVRKLRFLLPSSPFPSSSSSSCLVLATSQVVQVAGWGVGPIQIQPSELMKLAMVVFTADLLARRQKRRDQWNPSSGRCSSSWRSWACSS